MMINHFSHRHPLNRFGADQHRDEEDPIICSGCELELLPDSAAYICAKSSCDFRLHDLCYELPREIRHSSHSQHPLALLFTPPPSFSCNACGESGTAFVYSCSACRFNLHVQCCALPESVSLEDRHPHTLTLAFSLPERRKDEAKEDSFCGACGCGFSENCWAYFCSDCGYGNHLECAIAENEVPEEGEWVGSGNGEAEGEEESPQPLGKTGDTDVKLVIAETQRIAV